MAVTLDQAGSCCLIRLDGEVNIFAAMELKKSLLAAVASGKDLEVNVEQATEFGVSALQLLWAAEREAKAAGLRLAFVGSIPEVVCSVLSEAGFAGFGVETESKES